jgi:hypothetical protein
MVLNSRALTWAGARLSRRFSRSVPLLGGLIAIVTIGAVMRRKGVVRGALDAGLTAVPFVGAAKIALETLTGREVFADRARGRR